MQASRKLIQVKPDRLSTAYVGDTGGHPMQRYFFHILDGRVLLDGEGMPLANIWEVRQEAIRRTAAYLTNLDNGLLFGGPWSMTVANEAGQTVFSLQFEAHTYNDYERLT